MRSNRLFLKNGHNHSPHCVWDFGDSIPTLAENLFMWLSLDKGTLAKVTEIGKELEHWSLSSPVVMDTESTVQISLSSHCWRDCRGDTWDSPANKSPDVWVRLTQHQPNHQLTTQVSQNGLSQTNLGNLQNYKTWLMCLFKAITLGDGLLCSPS